MDAWTWTNPLHVTLAIVLLATALLCLDLMRKYALMKSQLLFFSAQQRTVTFVTQTIHACVNEGLDTLVATALAKGSTLMQHPDVSAVMRGLLRLQQQFQGRRLKQ